jgi:hypothetical protein
MLYRHEEQLLPGPYQCMLSTASIQLPQFVAQTDNPIQQKTGGPSNSITQTFCQFKTSMQADVRAVSAVQEARCCSEQVPLQDRSCSGQQMCRTGGVATNVPSGLKKREGLTWLVEGNWLTSAMKFMTKGVAGRSKISFGVPTCSMRPLQRECKPSLGSTTQIYSVHI